MELSRSQTLIGLGGIASLTLLVIFGDVSGEVVVPIIAALAGNALGYVNGKRTANRENGTPK